MKEKYIYILNSYFYMEYDNFKKNYNYIYIYVYVKFFILNEWFR